MKTPFKHARGLTRWTMIVPGFDCRRRDCIRPNAGDHGVHCEEWIYVVSDGDHQHAFELMVMTNRFPATVTHIPAEPPTGGTVVMHSRFPEREDQQKAEGCVWLGCADCYSDVGFIYASQFFERVGSPDGPAQPETFWLAMEEEYRSRVRALAKARETLA